MSLSSLSLYPATPSQAIESRLRTHSQWSKGLNLEEYLELNSQMDTWECGRDGRLITWVLAPRDDPETLGFLCSCKTFRRVGMVNETQVSCYAIGSAFTPPQHRNKGYGRHMMRLLHWVLAAEEFLPSSFPKGWGDPPQRVKEAGDASFSVLWSDVGPDFYAKCGLGDGDGWTVQSSLSTVWPGKPSSSEQSPDWEYLSMDAVHSLWPSESIRMRSQMPPSSFALFPINGVESYQRLRILKRLEKHDLTIDHWGIKSEDALATWTFDLPTTLLITHLRATPSVFSSLFCQLQSVASRYGMQKIEAWNLPSDLGQVAQDVGGEEIERAESLPCVRYYGKEEGLRWAFNERFCWC